MSEKPGDVAKDSGEAADTGQIKPPADEKPAATTAAATDGLPASTDARADVVTTRTGMFGVQGTGDTSGFGGLVRSVSMPAPALRPYGGYFDEIADRLSQTLKDNGTDPQVAVEAVVIDRDELSFVVRREHIVEVCRRLRDEPDLRFEMCVSISGVHYPDDAGRELRSVYHLLSITHNRRVRLEVTIPDSDRHVPSVVEVYPTADWHERETWDFFGIIYDGHPALTRIQMPDDWPGHPQRKDYPLGGIPVEYKGATIPPPDRRRSYS